MLFTVIITAQRRFNRTMDEIDYQIVSLLQEDARLSNAALGKAVGLTTSTVHDRVKKLEKKGIIKGYVALVNPQALGKPIMAFIRLTVGQGDYLESKNKVMKLCQAEPDILECHGVAGTDCYVLKVRVKNPHDLERLIEEIRCHAEISQTITTIVLSTFKDSTKITP